MPVTAKERTDAQTGAVWCWSSASAAARAVAAAPWSRVEVCGDDGDIVKHRQLSATACGSAMPACRPVPTSRHRGATCCSAQLTMLYDVAIITAYLDPRPRRRRDRPGRGGSTAPAPHRSGLSVRPLLRRHGHPPHRSSRACVALTSISHAEPVQSGVRHARDMNYKAELTVAATVSGMHLAA